MRIKVIAIMHFHRYPVCLPNSTRMAFESKVAKSSKSTDFRISPTLCTMFNVMVDAKDQSAKLCAMEMGQEANKEKNKVNRRFYFSGGIHVLIFRILTACLNARVPHMTSEKSSSVFLLLFIKRDRPEVT